MPRFAGRLGVPFVAFVAAAATGCATSWSTAALGSYDDFAPYVRIQSSTYELELERAAHVAILAIVPPVPSLATQYHITFNPLYPLRETDPTFFESGSHRLRSRGLTELMRRRCSDGEVPSIGGCIASWAPGYRRVPEISPQVARRHYLVVVSEAPVDPFTLAYHLEEARLHTPDLTEALYERNVQRVVPVLTQVIADLPGSPHWAGFYVVRDRW